MEQQNIYLHRKEYTPHSNAITYHLSPITWLIWSEPNVPKGRTRKAFNCHHKIGKDSYYLHNIPPPISAGDLICNKFQVEQSFLCYRDIFRHHKNSAFPPLSPKYTRRSHRANLIAFRFFPVGVKEQPHSSLTLEKQKSNCLLVPMKISSAFHLDLRQDLLYYGLFIMMYPLYRIFWAPLMIIEIHIRCEKETASSFMVASLSCGLALGSMLSIILVQIL
uniref:Uncharacterized protein n=1 Tax=Glossina austeni TaxID=7395 RepID=A0A1A9UDC4_GLOAU